MAGSDGLGAGDLAPTFTLADHSGASWGPKAAAGRRLVLFFFPRADTPGCTTQAQDFSARAVEFDALKTSLVGISADPPRKLARFRERRRLVVTLLSDEAGATLRAYGVWGEKSMYGKSFEGILRTTFIIREDGRIAQVWRGVKVPGHAATVLEFIRKMEADRRLF